MINHFIRQNCCGRYLKRTFKMTDIMAEAVEAIEKKLEVPFLTVLQNLQFKMKVQL